MDAECAGVVKDDCTARPKVRVRGLYPLSARSTQSVGARISQSVRATSKYTLGRKQKREVFFRAEFPIMPIKERRQAGGTKQALYHLSDR